MGFTGSGLLGHCLARGGRQVRHRQGKGALGPAFLELGRCENVTAVTPLGDIAG